MKQPLVFEIDRNARLPPLVVWVESPRAWVLVEDSNAGSHWEPLEDGLPGLGAEVLSAEQVEELTNLHGAPEVNHG